MCECALVVSSWVDSKILQARIHTTSGNTSDLRTPPEKPHGSAVRTMAEDQRRQATIPIVQPPILQEGPGDKPKDIRLWLTRIGIYFAAVDHNRPPNDQLRDQHKISMLLPLLGAEGLQRIVNNPVFRRWEEDQAAVTFAELRQVLMEEFGQTVTVEKCRFDYFRRFQEAGETIQEYVGGLAQPRS